MAWRTRRPVRFGPFALDVETGELLENGILLPLQAQPARLLALLVAHAGHVVTREQIRAHLWGGTVVAYDQNINYAIRQIRIALGEHGASLVQTVARTGYRFAPPARSVSWVDRIGRAATWTRGAAVPLAAGLLLGITLARGNLPRGMSQAAAWNVNVDWTSVRMHLTGEARCPYYWLAHDPAALAAWFLTE